MRRSIIKKAKYKNKGYILWDENVTITIYEKQLNDILLDEIKISSFNNKNNVITIYGLNLLYLADLIVEQKWEEHDDYIRIDFGKAEIDIYDDITIMKQNQIEIDIKKDMMFKLLSIYQEIYNINFDAKKMEKDN